jgi:glycosyltransferase involved in cell wall biosynthesis
MNKQPLISVIMPVYNGELFLERAIESILVQTFENFEFIIINDGSSDKSLEVIEKYKKKDERIFLISRKNKGLVYSLNEGIENSKGEYIARMDADDISLTTRLEEQIAYIENNKLDLCGSWVHTFDKRGVSDIWKYPENHNDIVFRSFFMSSFAHPSVMIKKAIFEKVKYQDELAEDYRLWCDILEAGYKVGNVQKTLLMYRLHNNQLTQVKSKEMCSSANQIGLNFCRKVNNKFSPNIERAIDIQNNCSLQKFNQLIEKILSFSKEQNLRKDCTLLLVKALYNNASPKTPLMYYRYLKLEKNIYNKYRIEVKTLLKSFVVFSRDSGVYKFLKKTKNLFNKR